MRPAQAAEAPEAVASTSCGAPATPEGGAAGVVGFLFSEKKRRSLLTQEFVERARLRGLRFVPVDPLRPLEEQEGHPFDVILHKARKPDSRRFWLRGRLQTLPSSSPDVRDWEARLASYALANPWVCVVDTPQAARQLSNRATMLQAVAGIQLGDGIGTSVAAPRQVVVEGDLGAVTAALRRSGLCFPLLAKSLLADGSESSHALALVYEEEGLARLSRGEVPGLRPPCVLQEFVDHGGSLFKVYVVGEAVSTARRRSLPDQHALHAQLAGGAQHRGGLEAVERISTLGAHWREQAAGGGGAGEAGGEEAYQQFASSPPGYFIAGAAQVPEPDAAFVRALAMALRAALGLQLFNFDLIRVAGAQDRFLVVDINYFPGIAKMPGYEAVFTDFLLLLVEASRAHASRPDC